MPHSFWIGCVISVLAVLGIAVGIRYADRQDAAEAREAELLTPHTDWLTDHELARVTASWTADYYRADAEPGDAR